MTTDVVNRDAWSTPRTLRWFSRFEGWSDPGERAAIAVVAEEARGGAILDLGVGAGRTIPILHAISDDYTGLDFAPAMVGLCQRLHPGVRVVEGDARDLGRFADGTFDLAVFSWNGIDAVNHDDRAQVISEVHRVLRPGGLFVVSTHNKDGPGHDEKPWTVRARDLVHPRHLAEVIVLFPANLRGYLRHRRLHVDGGEWALKTAAAHRFGIVIHYTTLAAARDELDAGGFETLAVFDERRGEPIGDGERSRHAWWFQMVARKR